MKITTTDIQQRRSAHRQFSVVYAWKHVLMIYEWNGSTPFTDDLLRAHTSQDTLILVERTRLHGGGCIEYAMTAIATLFLVYGRNLETMLKLLKGARRT